MGKHRGRGWAWSRIGAPLGAAAVCTALAVGCAEIDGAAPDTANGFVDPSGGGVLLLMLSWLGVALWVFLLAAFALGLPSMEAATVTDEPEAAPTADRPAAMTPDSGAG